MKIAITICGLLLAIIAVAPTWAAATPEASPVADPAGCSGLAVYRDAISVAYRNYVQRRVEQGVPIDVDRRSLTPKQWKLVAAELRAYANALAAIVPPAWAAAWHAALIAEVQTDEQFATASASRGIPYANALWGNQRDQRLATLDAAAQTASQACPTIDRLYGLINGDGAASATPSPID